VSEKRVLGTIFGPEEEEVTGGWNKLGSEVQAKMKFTQ
jgi:hypothetical protein